MIKSKIIITGGNGFLGRFVVNKIKNNYKDFELIIPNSKELDLRDRVRTIDFFLKHKPQFVFSIAARLGGIGDNRSYPANYFYDNITIGINTIDAARISGAEKIINIGTVCSYPKDCPVPFVEENLWNGYPEPTNGAYGISKKAVMEYALASKKQYGLNCVNLLLTNLYGPEDDFREETSHVIPALIKKIVIAKEKNIPTIEAWGDGSPTRDFLYVEDAAEGISQSLHCQTENPVNLGSGKEISIKKLYELLCNLLDYQGQVMWDITKPNGQPRRLLDISKAKKEFNFNPNTNFEMGLKNTIDWYLKNRKWIDTLPKKYVNE
jgi:GDP-L-fucose synthase